MKRKIDIFRRHFRRWNAWRKSSVNCKFHQILVLLKLVKSPTFEMFLLPEEIPTYKTIFHGPDMMNEETEFMCNRNQEAYEATKALCASLNLEGVEE